MFRRRREYYIGDRGRRRRRGPVFAVALAAVALIGSTTLAISLPASGLIPAQSTASPAVASAPAPGSLAPSPAGTPASSASPPATLPPSPPPCEAPSTITPAPVVSHGDIKKKLVALTFDDGENKANTLQILDILKRRHVNATFFPTGYAMNRWPDVWKKVANADYPIANHTYSHVELAGLCFEAQRRELARANDTFEKLGITRLPVMRPPYELFDDTTAAAAAAEGIEAVVLWNVDTNDWQGASATSIRRSALAGGRGSIILLHTFPEATAAALPGIIKGFRARGFEFVTIGQMLGIDGPVPFPTEAD